MWPIVSVRNGGKLPKVTKFTLARSSRHDGRFLFSAPRIVPLERYADRGVSPPLGEAGLRLSGGYQDGGGNHYFAAVAGKKRDPGSSPW